MARRLLEKAITTNEGLEEALHSWIQTAGDKPVQYFTGIDVGGTNARVTLGTSLTGEFLKLPKLTDVRSVADLCTRLADLGARVVKILKVAASSGCIAVAGPPSRDRQEVPITNYPLLDGAPQVLRLCDLPSSLFPPGKSVLLNDLEAACYGILGLNDDGSVNDYYAPLWPTETSSEKGLQRGHYGVLAAGTGLGVGLITAETVEAGCSMIGPHADFRVVALEGGHQTVPGVGRSHPLHEEETALLTHLSKTLYGETSVIEYEDAVSGRGLLRLYQYFSKDDPQAPKHLTAEEIANRAMQSPRCEYSYNAMLYFNRLLLRCAKQLSVLVRCHGIFLAGDNQVTNKMFVQTNLDALKKEFLDHTKPGWVEQVIVFSQTKLLNANVRGTLFVAQKVIQDEKGM